MSSRLSARLTSSAAALLRRAPRPSSQLRTSAAYSSTAAKDGVTASSNQPAKTSSAASTKPPATNNQESTSQTSPVRKASKNRKVFRKNSRNKFQGPGDLGRLLRAISVDGQIKLFFEGDLAKDPISWPHIWFRDICHCSQCVSESSGQKRFATCDIDAHPKVESCNVRENGDLEIVWADDFMGRPQEGRPAQGDSNHTSVYPLSLLHRLLTRGTVANRPTPARTIWDRATILEGMEVRNVSYEDWMAGGSSFAKAMLDLEQWGIVIVKGVPGTKDAVKDIANKIGDLQSTFYGLTWDVISKPQAENVAYTNEFLCLHQDLMYWSSPPKIQLLHCLANDCAGGDSLFSDGFRAASEFQLLKPEQWRILESKDVLYHYARNGNYYSVPRRVIKQQREFLPKSVFWSPPFQGPFHLIEMQREQKFHSDLPQWRDAARAFKDSLEAPENMLQYRLQPGDCVLFDNHRVLHGRTQFDVSSGHRHLHGTYIDSQTLASAFVRLEYEGLIGAGLNFRQAKELEMAHVARLYGNKKGDESREKVEENEGKVGQPVRAAV